MAIYVTGDIHGTPFPRLNTKIFPDQKHLTKDDYVIICGDFGVIWNGTKTEKYLLDDLQERNFTTLFVDGNHEDFDRLNAYPVETWHGGKVHKVRPNVIHLMRGQVFHLQGKTFWTFGGARSHDIRDGVLEVGDPRIKEWNKDHFKLFRVNHVSWWAEEMPNSKEMAEGLSNLEKENFKVDFIITHAPPASVARAMYCDTDEFENYLQDVMNRTEVDKWFCGHMHPERNFYFQRVCVMYEKLMQIV